jgi:class 3 adenylate cyclase
VVDHDTFGTRIDRGLSIDPWRAIVHDSRQGGDSQDDAAPETPEPEAYSPPPPSVADSSRVQSALQAYYRRLNADTSTRRRDRTNRLSRWLRNAEDDEQAGGQPGAFRDRRDPLHSEREQRLEEEITQLTQRLDVQTTALLREQQAMGATNEKFNAAMETLAALQSKQAMASLTGRIDPAAVDAAPDLLTKFVADTACQALVMSVDLRRSTDLMLKAREPQLFAQFIRSLCDTLRDIILASQGVFDKFTGDGILAFFPDFYSGEDAAFRAVHAAAECHKAFLSHYQRHHSAFNSVLKDVGLGIGIDYGVIHLVRVGDEITVVGTPVVYACRMSGAPAGSTLLNQRAYEEVLRRFSSYCSIHETEIDLKHEGVHIGYSVHLNGRHYEPEPPAWKISHAADVGRGALTDDGKAQATAIGTDGARNASDHRSQGVF